ncbi:MAG: DMT family transporter [Actinobacteria bacterium]|nr:DMT family transporter [Actinomycetota bacterium]
MSARAPIRSETPRRTLGILAVSYTTFVWGLVPLVLRQIDMPTLAFTSWRLWCGVVLNVGALYATGRRLRWETIRVCALGGVLFAADISITFGAFRLTSIASASIIGAVAPIFIALGAARWFGERMARSDLWFGFACFGGVALVAAGSHDTSSWSLGGDLLAALGTLSWTSYWLYSKRARRDLGPLEYIATVMLVAAVCVTSVTALTGTSLAPPRGQDWLWVVSIAIFPGAIGHVLVAWAHRHVEAWLGSLITQCVPVVASVSAWIVLGEPLTPLIVIGGLIVLAATAVIVIRVAGREAADVGTSEPPLIADPAG